MAENDLQNALDNCIDRLAAGESVEDCLRAHPQHAAALRPMLESGLLARRARPDNAEIAAAQERARTRFESTLEAQTFRRFRVKREPGMGPLLRAAALIIALAFVSLLMAGGGAVALAQNSLPGDRLYDLKRLTERVQLSLASDADSLQAEFAARRITETESLLRLNRAADVTFAGTVDDIAEDAWMVAGLRVEIAPETILPRFSPVGMRAEVDARTTTEGNLIAAHIRPVIDAESTEDVPTVAPTQSATRTPERATSTRAPTRTSIPTRTPSPTRVPCQPAQPAGWQAYTVQPGDSLARLSTAHNVTVERIMQVNCIEDANVIAVGRRLMLPALPPTDAPPTEDTRPDEPPPGDDRPPSDDRPPDEPTRRPAPTDEPERDR